MALNQEDVEKLIRWNNNGKFKIVFVKSKGEHMKVRNGSPTPGFWDLWKTNKVDIKELGISVKKEENEETGASNWIIAQWAEATEEEKEEAQADWEKKMATRDQNDELIDSEHE